MVLSSTKAENMILKRYLDTVPFSQFLQLHISFKMPESVMYTSKDCNVLNRPQ
jgi:hypothetical protein